MEPLGCFCVDDKAKEQVDAGVTLSRVDDGDPAQVVR